MSEMIRTMILMYLLMISSVRMNGYWRSTREIKVDCQPGWEVKDDNCYKYFSDPVPWDQAKATCQAYGGMIVAVKNYYQNEYVGNMVESKGGKRFWIDDLSHVRRC
ncbi:hypothetical protein LOTGIDRAFT_156427 [Lottia gigantea]|uniref:C-type lectin domain-containing protein n=1 Tax=Lottia gigantea TaxID=225164 RepID=V4B0R9_LOTGI|nr:hypothetical protein LOTGIDRAFT_156427 [Lottia gigantea]ESP03828.1 hypothetical protein LOTGIDRAFT_156427 [Lottia gigantea]